MYKRTQDIVANPCVKTGCTALIAGDLFHGDLFDFGNYLLLNCSAPGHPVRDDEVNGVIHMVAISWQQRLQQNHVVILHPTHVSDYVYEGRMYQNGLVVSA